MIAPILDSMLEASVVGSFTRIGYHMRSRHWHEPLPSMVGSTVVVTGATSGIGLSASHQMANLGARVALVGRNPDKLSAAVESIAGEGGDAVGYLADLSILSDVRRVGDEITSSEESLRVVVNNVSILAPERTTTPEGFDITLATNLLGPFLLTNLLIPRLVENSPGRIITVSSGGMYTEGLDVENLDMGDEGYRGATAYAKTKRAQVVLTELWAQRLEDTGVVAHSMHPGWVDTPGVATSLPTFGRLLGPLLRSPEQGADTIVWLASADDALASSGRFWSDRSQRRTHRLKRTKPGDAQRDELWSFLSETTLWNPPPGWPHREID